MKNLIPEEKSAAEIIKAQRKLIKDLRHETYELHLINNELREMLVREQGMKYRLRQVIRDFMFDDTDDTNNLN